MSRVTKLSSPCGIKVKLTDGTIGYLGSFVAQRGHSQVVASERLALSESTFVSGQLEEDEFGGSAQLPVC